MSTIEKTRLAHLKRLIAEVGSQRAFADKLECSPAQLSQYVNGYRNIGRDFARRVESAFKKENGWMDTAEGWPSAPAQVSFHVAEQIAPYGPPSPTEDEFTLVPQLDVSASCGSGAFVDHVVVKGGLAFKKSSLRDFGIPENAARVIYASGGSMEPSIQDGCVVLLNTADNDPREGRVYAICQPDGSLVLKRLIHDYNPATGQHEWIMRSDNPNKTMHPDKRLPPDSRTMIAGRAVWNDNRL
jgi:phage repressor protein C with HTH and peptisase S24 domain